MSFESFRKSRGNGSSLLQKIENASIFKKESEYYYPELDQDGKATSVIRFLPSKNEDELPYVTVYSHAFKGNDNRWLFQNLCPSTYGKPCAICATNSELWNTQIKENQDVVRERKRKKSYIFNIVVIRDSSNPSNNGKVFQYSCGTGIFNKILSAMKPAFEDEAPMNPFDVFEGNNFILRIKRDPSKNGMITYEDSKFDTKNTAIADSDAELEKIYNEMKDLNHFIDPSRSEPEENILRRLPEAYSAYKFLSINKQQSVMKSAEPAKIKESVSSESEKLPWDDVPETGAPSEGGMSDDDLEYFRKLAQN